MRVSIIACALMFSGLASACGRGHCAHDQDSANIRQNKVFVSKAKSLNCQEYFRGHVVIAETIGDCPKDAHVEPEYDRLSGRATILCFENDEYYSVFMESECTIK